MFGRKIWLLLILVAFAAPLSAQNIQITPFYGFIMGGSMNVYEGKLNIKDSWNYGFMFDLEVQPGIQLEFSYTYQDSYLELQKTFGVNEKLFDIGVHTWQLGVLREMRQDNIGVFGVGGLGFTNYSPQDAEYSNEYLFSVTAGLGAKLYVSDRIGLRLQGRLLFPINWAGGGLWCGPGGCSVGINSGSYIMQGDITGGLIIIL